MHKTLHNLTINGNTFSLNNICNKDQYNRDNIVINLIIKSDILSIIRVNYVLLFCMIYNNARLSTFFSF